MRAVGMHEAKTHFSRLVERVRAGEEILIQRSGKPVARLVPVDEASSVAGSYGMWRDQVRIADDFDDPLPEDVADAFGAGDPAA